MNTSISRVIQLSNIPPDKLALRFHVSGDSVWRLLRLPNFHPLAFLEFKEPQRVACLGGFGLEKRKNCGQRQASPGTAGLPRVTRFMPWVLWRVRVYRTTKLALQQFLNKWSGGPRKADLYGVVHRRPLLRVFDRTLNADEPIGINCAREVGVEICSCHWPHYTNGATVSQQRVGKRAAGRLLDGVEHNGMPERAR
jgi:hypothetical protein